VFNYMIKILPNNRILIRDTESGEVEVILPKDVPKYFENLLSEEIANQDESEAKVSELKEQVKKL